MREATLGGVSALDTVRPRAPAGRSAGGKARRASAPGPRFKKMRAHLALIVGSSGFSAIMIGIVLNATVMQKEHHPAPLFGTAPVHAPPTPRPAPVVAPPAEAAAPAAVSAPALLSLPAPAPLAAPTRPVAQAKPLSAKTVHPRPIATPHAAVAPHAKTDGIAKLLGGPASPTAKPVPAKPHHAAPAAHAAETKTAPGQD